jgi:hypothetical protein
MPSPYVVTFDRISRNHNVPPLNVAGGPQAIAEQIWDYARPKCGSRDIDVIVDMEAMAGTIYAGFHVAGSFTLEARDA